jgi:TM2 domain-containing membrane protein YozV
MNYLSMSFLQAPKKRSVAIALSLLGTILAFPFPVAGLHKFYLGQPLWGIIYLLLWQTPIPRIACAIDVVFYLVQGSAAFSQKFGFTPVAVSGSAEQVPAIAQGLRELEQLRLEGLISEYEFEQKRRQLLEQIN